MPLFLAFAEQAAEEARRIVRKYFRAPLSVESKADDSPVTVADREVEEAIRRLIETRFPTHGIVGEEGGRTRPEAPFQWVIDPIDGTKSFIAGVPLFCTLIALLHEGAPVLGLIDQPITGERWLGGKGVDTTLNGTPVSARPCRRLSEAVLMAADTGMFSGKDRTAFDALSSDAGLTRFSADAYAYALIASGTVDLVCEARMHLHDYAALVPVLEGAGATISDWRGTSLTPDSDGHVLAAGDARAHEIALKTLGAHV